MSFYSNTPIIFGGLSGVTATRGAKDPELGTRVNYAGNEFVYVYNAATSDIPIGYAVTPLAGTTTGFSCTISTTAQIDVPMGVVKNATLSASCYGWVQTRGACNIHVSAAVTQGAPMQLGANGLWVSGVTGPFFAKLLATVSAATNVSGLAYLSCQ
jgi:hypothetical protein